MKCKNCGAALKYDPKEKILYCESCGSRYSAEERAEQNSDYAEEAHVDKEYYVYKCPSCGAELIGTYDTAAVGFCSYCGGQSIIRSKLEHYERPTYIIPFSKTREECCDEYLNQVKSLPFVPKELKDREFIKELRGIFVPYYIYKTDINGHAIMSGEYSSSTYNYTFSVNTDISGSLNIPVDASVQMDDDIGMKIFPTDTNDTKPFDTDYLTNYYAEMPDITPDTYVEKNNELLETTIAQLYKERTNADGTYKVLNMDKLDVNVSKLFLTLVPVYFLTYCKNNRVCYMIFGGRKTEKKRELYGEVPIDTITYIITSLILTILCTISLTMFNINLKHNIVLTVLSFLSCAGTILIRHSINKQAYRLIKSGRVKNVEGIKGATKVALSGLIFIGICAAFSNIGFYAIALVIYSGFSGLITAVVSGYVLCSGLKVIEKSEEQITPKYLYCSSISTIITSIVATIGSHIYLSDSVYYTVMILTTVGILVGVLGVYKQYNYSCTRTLPQFTREGGYNGIKD